MGATIAGAGHDSKAYPATPETATHPLVGSWFLYNPWDPDDAEQHWLVTFAADGTVTGASQSDVYGASHGV